MATEIETDQDRLFKQLVHFTEVELPKRFDIDEISGALLALLCLRFQTLEATLSNVSRFAVQWFGKDDQ